MAVNPKNPRDVDPGRLADLLGGIERYRIMHKEIAREYGCCRAHVTKVLTGRRRMTQGLAKAIRAVIRRRCREVIRAEMRSMS